MSGIIMDHLGGDEAFLMTEYRRSFLTLLLTGKQYGARNTLSDLVYRPPYAWAGIIGSQSTVIDHIVDFLYLPRTCTVYMV